jgi:3'-phosphoadenosine 5'-phosphosulfate (PAPS) 3'-phosphatase
VGKHLAFMHIIDESFLRSTQSFVVHISLTYSAEKILGTGVYPCEKNVAFKGLHIP